MAMIDDLLQRARIRLNRLAPEDAAAELEGGALLVDTRTETQRSEQGEIPGALIIRSNSARMAARPDLSASHRRGQ
jgi:rhodanese-related sulfurtransferase